MMQLRQVIIGLSLAIALPPFSNGRSLTSMQVQAKPTLPQRITQTTPAKATPFKVRIENTSTPNSFTASNGQKWTLEFSPGVWVIHDRIEPIFARGERDWGEGLEAIAEDGNLAPLVKFLQNQGNVKASGVLGPGGDVTKGSQIEPGQTVEFIVSASPGQRLFFIIGFRQANDWFYAPPGEGIALFDSKQQPASGDVTSQILLWNLGTEVDQEPGMGSNQAAHQSTPNTGAAENSVVQLVTTPTAYSQPSKVMRVTITPIDQN